MTYHGRPRMYVELLRMEELNLLMLLMENRTTPSGLQKLSSSSISTISSVSSFSTSPLLSV